MTTVPPTQSGVGTVSPTSLMPSLMLETASPILTSPLDEEDDTGWPTMSPTRDIASSNVDVSDNESCLIYCIRATFPFHRLTIIISLLGSHVR